MKKYEDYSIKALKCHIKLIIMFKKTKIFRNNIDNNIFCSVNNKKILYLIADIH